MGAAIVRVSIIVFRMEFARQVRRRQALWLPFAMAALVGFNMVLVGTQMKKVGAPAVARAVVDMQFTHLALSLGIASFFILGAPVFIQDRHTRALETLLAAPLRPQSILFGKCLACWVFGVECAVLGAIGGWAAFCLTVGTFVFPNPVILPFMLITGPLLIFCVMCVMGIANLLARNTTAVNIAFFYLGFGYLFLAAFRAKAMQFDWKAHLVFAMVTVATALLSIVLAKKLHAEDMIVANYGVAKKPSGNGGQEAA